jgi:predicted esterase
MDTPLSIEQEGTAAAGTVGGVAARATPAPGARGASREHHLTVTRTARYVTLGEAGPATRELWIVCHGHGQLAARFVRHFALLDDGTRLIAAPEALSRYYIDAPAAGTPAAERRVGATWMTREDRLSEINDQVGYLDALHAHLVRQLDGRAVRLHVLGFSQGVATVCRWLAASRVRPHDVTLWAGTLPPDLDLASAADALRGARLVLVSGARDEFATPELLAHQDARLRDAGVRFRFVTFDGGHQLDAATLARLAAQPHDG